MEPIVRARTCQNCMHGQFKKRDWMFASGKNINGLCMRYADSPMPPKPNYGVHNFFAYLGNSYHPIVLRFKNARALEDIPTLDEWLRALKEAPSWMVERHQFYNYFNGVSQDWYAEQYEWSAWWIRNWQTVAERKIDRTTCCAAWDGNQTQRFYKPVKAKAKKS